MKKADLKILREFYDPYNDYLIILGRAPKTKKTIGRYVVGFCHRSEQKITDMERFLDRDSANERLEAIVAGFEMPENSKMLLKDWQQNDVYAWEEKFIAPYSPRLTRQQTRDIVAKVCADLGMEEPKLYWTRPKPYSWYDEEDHSIHLGHRDLCTVLHELAHAYVSLKEDAPEVHTNHAPAFVWAAIELYSRYAGFSTDYLVQSAHMADLLGPLDKESMMQPRRKFRAP